MSYILEALKKAQAERQLGNAPTIHAPVIRSVPAAGAGRKPLVAGIAAAAVLVAGALTLWRQQPAAPAPQVIAAAPAPATNPVPAPEAVAQPSAPAAATGHVALVPAPALAPGPAARPRSSDHPSTPGPAAAPASPAPSAPTPQAPVPQAQPAPAANPAPPASAAAAPAAAEEALHTLNELPEAIRAAVPKVTFGGYMYSPNAADRLVLVDKTLRREGEEVAPGLVLEKLLPRGAVMNYRGYRYRVPF